MSPTCVAVSSAFFNAKTEVRAATRSSRIFASTFRISSVIPSLKYSWSPSGLRSSNGSTAIDGRGSASGSENASVTSADRSDVPESASAPVPRRPAHQAPAANSTTPASASRPAGQRLLAGSATIASISPGAAASILFMPPGASSNAQASTIATGNPRIRRATTNGTKVSGSRIASASGSATWMRPNATAPYTADTLKTLRRFSSAKNCW